MCAPSKYYTYLFAGKPIISVMEPDSYISKEVVDEGIGFAVENGDSAGFEKAIRRLLEDPALARGMGIKARESYERKYKYETAMAKYLYVIKDVIGDN